MTLSQIAKARIVNLILFAFCVVLFTVSMQQCEEAKQTKSALLTSKDVAKFWRDKAGHSNAEIAVMKLDRENFNKYHNNLVDSLKKQGINSNRVESVTLITSETAGAVTLKFNSYTDHWRSFRLSADTLFYKSRDSLALISHHQKYGFLNLKSKYVVRAIAYNPHTTLTGITSTEIISKNRRVSLGFYSGYGINLSNGKPGFQIGAGLTVKIF